MDKLKQAIDRLTPVEARALAVWEAWSVCEGKYASQCDSLIRSVVKWTAADSTIDDRAAMTKAFAELVVVARDPKIETRDALAITAALSAAAQDPYDAAVRACETTTKADALVIYERTVTALRCQVADYIARIPTSNNGGV